MVKNTNYSDKKLGLKLENNLLCAKKLLSGKIGVN